MYILISIAVVIILAIIMQMMIKGKKGSEYPKTFKDIKKLVKNFYIGNMGVITEYGVISVVTEVVSNGYLKVGFAFCSPKDQFIKSKGRELAGNKMNWVTKFTGHSSEDVVRLFNHEMRDDKKPARWRNVELYMNSNYTVGFYEKSDNSLGG